jgi:hypothetical protein
MLFSNVDDLLLFLINSYKKKRGSCWEGKENEVCVGRGGNFEFLFQEFINLSYRNKSVERHA